MIDKNESLDRQLEGQEIRGKEEEHTNLWGGERLALAGADESWCGRTWLPPLLSPPRSLASR